MKLELQWYGDEYMSAGLVIYDVVGESFTLIVGAVCISRVELIHVRFGGGGGLKEVQTRSQVLAAHDNVT